MKKIYYSYEEFKDDTRLLVPLLKKERFDAIVAIARGGLIFAHALAQALDIRNVQSLSTQLYDDTQQRDCIEIQENCSLEQSKKVLVVDDIADSGETLKAVLHRLQSSFVKTDFATVTLFYKESACIKPDFWARHADCWIEFFWEKDFMEFESA